MHSLAAMRKLGLGLLLALLAGCSTPDRHRDLRTPEPVNATRESPVMEFLVYVIYFLGQWLGPRT